MTNAALKSLLRFAILHIEIDIDALARRQFDPRTNRIEPESVRRDVEATKRWLEKAKAAVSSRA